MYKPFRFTLACCDLPSVNASELGGDHLVQDELQIYLLFLNLGYSLKAQQGSQLEAVPVEFTVFLPDEDWSTCPDYLMLAVNVRVFLGLGFDLACLVQKPHVLHGVVVRPY